MRNLYYCVLKNYKGFFKKKHTGNTHLLFAPISDNKYMYLGIVGKLVDNDDLYTSQLLTEFPRSLLVKIVEGEKEHFGDRYIILEKLKCNPKNVGEDDYIIKLVGKGKYIKSDLLVTLSPDLSSSKQKIFVIKANLDLESEDITPETVKMKAIKKMSFLGNLSRLLKR
jgi:hypothetical protein